MDLCKLAHAETSTAIVLVSLDVLMITLGIASAMTSSRRQSLTWFVISCILYILMVITIQAELEASVENYGDDVKSMFEAFKMVTLVSWSAYPVVVLLGDQNAFCSFGALSHDMETIVLCLLDIVSKVGVEVIIVAWKMTTSAKKGAYGSNSTYSGSESGSEGGHHLLLRH